MKLSILQRIQLEVMGYAYIGHRKYPDWSGPIPFYAFKCPEHGLVTNYPHGYRQILECPKCRKVRINVLNHREEDHG